MIWIVTSKYQTLIVGVVSAALLATSSSASAQMSPAQRGAVTSGYQQGQIQMQRQQQQRALREQQLELQNQKLELQRQRLEQQRQQLGQPR